MSRELDEQVISLFHRLMDTTEESGFPRHVIPLLMLLTAVSFLLFAYVTTAAVP